MSTVSEQTAGAAEQFYSLVELLRRRAQDKPNRLAYVFLADGETEETRLSYGELDRRARAIAATLQGRGAGPGERVLMLYPAGLEYVAAFLGCLYAGAVAVPAYPPRLNRSLERLQTLAADAQPKLALTTESILSRVAPRLCEASGLSALPWLSTDEMPDNASDDWREPAVGGETLAFLQYTSGSTGQPRGVMLTHGNLLHNSSLLARAFEYGPEDYCVSWLPVYHDMGLIGGVLQPLYGEFPCALMPPTAFLQRPLRWLQAISRYKATISGAPNFAYELCLRKSDPEQIAALDLSGWAVAFNGAEPVRSETLARFAEAFAPCGFRREAFYPCYGLAEATLLVAGSRKSSAPVVEAVRAEPLGRNRVVKADVDTEGVSRLVGCGGEPRGQRVVIVNPRELTPCTPEEVGEIWVSGPSVARGYWNSPDETDATFNARLSISGEGPFLRTGDLGFKRDGELFVTGRLKDLIILRGRNHYPQDIERTVEGAHPSLAAHGCAAFSVEAGGQERLAVVQEVDRRSRADLKELIDAIRQAVTQAHEVSPAAVVLVKPGGVPKTSSGKVRRRACRELFQGGGLDVLREWREAGGEEAAAREDRTLDPPRTIEELKAWLVSQLAVRSGRAEGEIDPDQPLARFGVDSLTAVELMHGVETGRGVSLPVSDFLGNSVNTIVRLSTEARPWTSGARDEEAPAPPYAPEEGGPLSHGQQAMWFLHRLAPESPVYNIASAARVRGGLDAPALRRALELLIERHASLRTVFAAPGGEPRALVRDRAEDCFWQVDAAGWSSELLERSLDEEAQRPFDLERGPLLRLSSFSLSPTEHIMLLVVHHIVADFWSLAVLLEELGELYEAESKGRPLSLPPLSYSYADYARRQRLMMAGAEGERLWDYWRRQLGGELPALSLPTDKPRPPVQTYNGASLPFALGAELTSKLKALSREQGVTLYTTLLAAFQTLLYRYTHQEDILVGSLTAGRNRAELAPLIGYFVNPIALRARPSGRLTFEEFLSSTRRTVLDAFAHQDYPFPLLVERLQPSRDPSRSPVFQAMFLLQKAGRFQEAGLGSFALGEVGARVESGGLRLESVALEQRVAQFDLTLVVAETGDRLGATLEYNTDLFDRETVARMAGHFRTLLEGVVDDPQQTLSALPMLTTDEQRQLITEFNDTGAAYPSEVCVHELFEAQVARTPDALALVCGKEALTFAELNARANKLARHLRCKGVGPEVRVGICAERSAEMVVGLLGVLKAGGAYVPLDPTYPRERLSFMLQDSEATVLLTQERLSRQLSAEGVEVVSLDEGWSEIDLMSRGNLAAAATARNAAYVIYTSGSTGRPKGVVVEHHSVVNFFSGISSRVGCDSTDTMLAVTSISFDISVLELLWTLAQGCRVVLAPERRLGAAPGHQRGSGAMQFSLFYFASDDQRAGESDSYRLLMEGAKFADRHGFTSVWTPERHFHAFGGLYPNPSVMSAALAALTERVKIRAGSVVLPLHHPVRVAEEWSLVDNLSKGRVGVAFASGWHADDFVFAPENYADRKDVMFRGIETVRELWRGGSARLRGGGGNEVEVKIYPRPVQPELPVWVTAAGSPETFARAGEIGANVLTHLLGQTVEEVAERVKIYRESLARHGHDPKAGHVTLMLHTYLGEDREAVREKVQAPFTAYLRSSVGLIANMIESLGLPLDLKTMGPADMDSLLAFAFDRYFETSALFGTVEGCAPLIERLKAAGVDEVACLIDFGVDADSALASLERLNELRALYEAREDESDYSVPALAERWGATLMQCTPSTMRMLALDRRALDALKPLRALLLGGEALPGPLARMIKEHLPGRLVNMYGPTETTIWSSTYEVDAGAITPGAIPLGRPIANTQFYILDGDGRVVPVGAPGELHIGGDGLARGYLNRPELTAESFIPDPFGEAPGARLYKTGDLARYLPGGDVEFLGRTNQQVKLRGYRIELGEIEAVLGEHAGVREAVVLVR